MDKITENQGIQFVPRFVKQISDMEYGSTVTHENYNAKLNLNTVQGDYNSEILRLLLTINNKDEVPHIPYLDTYINEIIDEVDAKAYTKDLSAVATSGSYLDLLDTPTKLSEFTNDTKFVNEDTLNNNLTNLSKEIITLFQNMDNRVTNVENTANSAIDSAASAQNTAISAEEKANTANVNAAEALTLAQSYGATIANKQDQLTAGANINIIDNVISATDTTYIAGDNVTIVDNVISSTDTKYTAGANITIDENNVISSTGGGGTGGGTVNSVNGVQPDETGNVQLMQVITPEYTIDGDYYVVDITNLKAGTYMIPPFAVPVAATSDYPDVPKVRFKCLKPGTTDTYLTATVGNINLYYYPVFIVLQTDVIEGLNALADGTLTTFRPGTTIYVGYTDYYERTYYNYAITIRTTSMTVSGGSSNPLNAVTTKSTQQTIAGLKKFSVLPQSTVVPADDADLVNKLYVDTVVANAGGAEYTAGENISISEDNVISAILKTYENIITEEDGTTTYIQNGDTGAFLRVANAAVDPTQRISIASNSILISDGDNVATLQAHHNYSATLGSSNIREAQASNGEIFHYLAERLGEESGPSYTLLDGTTGKSAELTTTDLILAGTSVMSSLNEKVNNGNTAYPIKVYVQDTQPAAEEGYTVVWINTAV